MAFRAEANIGGVIMDCLYCDYELSRLTDDKGKPTSGVKGGRINIGVESTADTSIVEKMVNSQFTPTEGSVTFKKPDEDGTMKTLEFKNAYVVYFKETIDVNGDQAMGIRFTISCEEITIGNATHDNRWPSA